MLTPWGRQVVDQGVLVVPAETDTETINRRSLYIEAARVKQDAAALLRRSYYVYTVTAAAFGLIILVLVLKPEQSLARTIVEASFSLIEIISVSYLGANIIDRSKLVDRVTKTMPFRPQPPPDGPIN